MASKEYLEKRVAGKEKEIAKLEAKLARIEKAEATGWTVNPYYYHESDKKYTARDLEEAKKDLDGYKEKLAEAIRKENSRNIKVILDFLEAWKKSAREYYESSVDVYKRARKVKSEEIKALDRSGLKGNEYWDAYRAIERAFRSEWGWLEHYMYAGALETARLIKDLDNEANAKYDFIIARTLKHVTEITDASGLYIGASGELNGYIVGTTGRVRVETIGAGGYNIQRYHFRTLIHAA